MKTEVGILGSSAPLDVRDNPRDAFETHTLATKWDHHKVIYFVGYEFWYYFSLPFCLLLPGFEVSETTPLELPNGEIWRGPNVTFPETMPTHTKVQRLYFDGKHRLRKMNYQVDIIFSRPAAHYCFDHETIEGMIVQTFRFVNRDLAESSHIIALTIQVTDVSVAKAV
jgi:hypothetical protein